MERGALLSVDVADRFSVRCKNGAVGLEHGVAYRAMYDSFVAHVESVSRGRGGDDGRKGGRLRRAIVKSGDRGAGRSVPRGDGCIRVPGGGEGTAGGLDGCDAWVLLAQVVGGCGVEAIRGGEFSHRAVVGARSEGREQIGYRRVVGSRVWRRAGDGGGGRR